MVQLALFLSYLALIVAFVWQMIRLVRDPSARTLQRLLFTLAAGAMLAFIVYYGVLQ